jgi:hypothetical protein
MAIVGRIRPDAVIRRMPAHPVGLRCFAANPTYMTTLQLIVNRARFHSAGQHEIVAVDQLRLVDIPQDLLDTLAGLADDPA